MEWAEANKAIQSGGRWERYTELRMGAGANMSVTRTQDDQGRTVYRAEAAWDNWSVFKVTGDYESAETALAAVSKFSSALVDLLGEKGAWKGLVSGVVDDS
jgi:hypothetical protein